MERVEEVKGKKEGKGSRFGKRYGFELKLRCVKLRLEEGLPVLLLSKEWGVSKDVVYRWVKAYQERGEEGLRNAVRSLGSRRRLPGPVRKKVIEIKKRESFFGVQRISHLLKRVFFLSASPETVRRTLQEESLMFPPPKRHSSNISRPRFFERSTPNQMWQGDIFTFRLGGRYAYWVGRIDDDSRYLVGLELYRSQTADQVIEVYRRAAGEYGVPKEVLTDRGRQYTNWRGTTRFERELGKDRGKHIKSAAHHPMTLGKIERFWKTIYEEFLVRAQFGSFEEAKERIRQWVQDYNHKRPHQGIGGLFPADRYFEIQGELRKGMEQGIAENVLEMALRGKPREPFYRVGRMEGQSVVLRVEKGEKAKEEKRGRRSLGHTSEEKCRAVLLVWTERRKPGEVCRELGVDWGILQQWQDRAMEGMLLALQPRLPVERGVALSPRLAVLLKRSQAGVVKRLDKRLKKLRGNLRAPQELGEEAAEKKV